MQVRKVTIKKHRLRIVEWIRSGAPVKAGVSLYASLYPDPVFLKTLRARPEENRYKLYQVFCEMLGINMQKFESIINEHYGKNSKKADPGDGKKPQGKIPESPQAPRSRARSFRSEWPFLSDPECPQELKALTADKISCWERYTEAHRKLFDCSSIEECSETARTLLENYKENRQIFDELSYYKQHNTVLGLHPVFKQYKRFAELRKLNVVALVELYSKTLPHRIWRIKSEIAKGDKPHLISERERRLKDAVSELSEVKR
jgi:hypothetical protein